MGQGRILILSSQGGYGHRAAVNTLNSIFSKDYDLSVVYPIQDLRIWGFKAVESAYNFMISHHLNRLLNLVIKNFSHAALIRRFKKMEKLMEEYIKAHKPDLIISLIPYVNCPVSAVAERHKIPFLLITTDNDLHNWVCGFDKKTPKNFNVTIGYDLPSTRKLLIEKGIHRENIHTIGLPLRSTFRPHANNQLLKKDFKIDQNRPVILIMMGGVGSKQTLRFAKKIAQLDLGSVLLACCGKNDKMTKKLLKIAVHPSNVVRVIPFTTHIDKLMAISDLVLTKPGPGSVNEAIAMQIPILLDQTKDPLFWEKANIDLIVHKKIGLPVKNLNDLDHLLPQILFDEKMRKNFAEAFSTIEKNAFEEEIKKMVHGLIQEKNQTNPLKLGLNS